MRRLFWVALSGVIGMLCFGGVALADQPPQASTVAVLPSAHTSFDRTYNWVVTKTDDQNSSVTIAQNEVFSVNYTITVSPGTPATTDSNWKVEDGLPILSSGPQYTINSKSDITGNVSQTSGANTAATIKFCSTDAAYQNLVTFPYTGAVLGCAWEAALPDGSAGTFNASVTFGDLSVATGSSPFDFTSAYLEPNQPTIKAGSVNIVDSVGGTLGTLSAPLVHPQTYTYSVTVPSATCGSFDMPNTVNVVDAVTGAVVAHASDTVHVTVTCPHVNGCTLTQGYWKTHSIYGPAKKADPTWNLLPLGPNTPFFLSGQTWIQVFNTSDATGNAYYILAHQYEAAVLNQLAGASSTAAVTAALADAKTFFSTYTPATAGALSSTSAARTAAINDATILDNYNNGLIGPGHCSE